MGTDHLSGELNRAPNIREEERVGPQGCLDTIDARITTRLRNLHN